MKGNVKMIRCFALASVVVAVTMDGFGRTLAWYHFDDTPGTVRGLNYQYPNAVDAAIHPLTIVEYKASQENPFMPLMATNFLARPCNAYRDGINGTTISNGCAISHMFNPIDSSDKGGGLIAISESAEETDLHLQTGTIEWFMKTTASGHWATLVSRLGDTTIRWFELYTEGKNLKLKHQYELGGTTDSETLTLHDTVFEKIRDGRWHHVAFTFDEGTHLFKFYMDHELFASKGYQGRFCYNPGSAWTFSGRANSGMKCGGAWDEIRISDAVLEPSQMLQFGSMAADGDALVHLPLDGDFKSVVSGELAITNDANAKACADYVRDGKTVFEPVDGKSIVEYGDKSVVVRVADVSAARMDECRPMISLGDFHLDAYSSPMTIEFFFKGESGIDTWNQILGLETESGSDGQKVLRVKRNDADSIQCLMDNPTESNGSINPEGVTLFDGKWHHLAFVITAGEWQGKPTQNTQLWVDYKKPSKGYKSQMGTLTPPKNLLLKLGSPVATGVAIDEVRITRGALDVGKFMRMKNNGGLLLILR